MFTCLLYRSGFGPRCPAAKMYETTSCEGVGCMSVWLPSSIQCFFISVPLLVISQLACSRLDLHTASQKEEHDTIILRYFCTHLDLTNMT